MLSRDWTLGNDAEQGLVGHVSRRDDKVQDNHFLEIMS